MNRYRIRISVDGKRKLYYIEDRKTTISFSCRAST